MGQSHLAGANQVVGMSMRVGIRIFSIVGGLGFEGGRSREYGRLQLVGQGLHLLHRLRMPGGALVRLRSGWCLVEGSIRRGQ